MARNHGKIETGFWQNPRVRALAEDARTLLLYLYSSPHSTAAGCYILPMAYAAHDLRWPSERVSEAFKQLSLRPFVLRDPTNDVTYICGWWEHNAVENANVAKHTARLLLALPDCGLKARAVKDLREFCTYTKALAEVIGDWTYEPGQEALPLQFKEEPRAPLGTVSGTVPKDHGERVSEGSQPEPEPEPEPSRSLTGTGAGQPRASTRERLPGSEHVRVVEEIWGAAGRLTEMDRWRAGAKIDDFRIVSAWLATNGWTVDEVLTAAKRVIATAGEIRSLWGLLAKAMPDEVARLRAGAAGPSAAQPVDAERGRVEQWRARMRSFHGAKQIWLGTWGPKPGENGCEVPPDVLKEFELEIPPDLKRTA